MGRGVAASRCRVKSGWEWGVRGTSKVEAYFSDTEPLDNYSYALYTSPPFSNLADRTGQRESYGFEMY